MSGVRACPCCGAPVAAPTRLDAALARLTPMQRRLVRAVVRCPGQTATELAAVVYADRADGGPDDAPGVVRVLANQIRLRGVGVLVTAGQGSRSGYYAKFDGE